MFRSRVAIVAVGVAFLFAVGLAAVYVLRSQGFAGEGGDVLLAIKNLEAEKDPKCHSTACRFEDFIYGTPLSEEARNERVELQKTFVRQIWAEASRAATDAGDSVVRVERIRPAIERLLTAAETEDGTIELALEGRDPLRISAMRARQFGSIAYALRAILGVEQDAMLSGEQLVRLDDESLDALRVAVETVSLGALQLADAESRHRSDTTVQPETMLAAWGQVVPAQRQFDGALIAQGGAERGLEMFLEMADNKISSYDTYGILTSEEAEARFWTNAQTFYARYALPSDEPGKMAALKEAYGFVMADFSKTLFEEAQRIATENGHALIRSADAGDAVERVLPHRVDDFEDLQFFFNLDDRFQVMVESYDCDAYRDTGQHWLFMKDAYANPGLAAMPPDPFAAEILAEAISSYGVLVLRVAGEMAETASAREPNLTPQHLAMGRRQIANLASHHQETEPRPESAARIVSAGGGQALPDDEAYFSDLTQESGVRFAHRSSKWLNRFRRQAEKPPTFSGGGVAAEDIDGDTHPDLLFVGGSGNALFVNDGRGRFRDVTERAGIDHRNEDGEAGEARQPIIADFDNDGRQDIFISYSNADHRLYRNRGDLRFEDVTEQAGLGGGGLIGGPATVFDFDNDGLLDVYITYFGDYLKGALPTQERHNGNALPNRLFRNLGSLRFEDVTRGSGSDDTGWCQGVSHTDFDRDGLQDIVVANDFGRNALLRNLGDGRFEDMAPAYGVRKAYHSMNVGLTDLNRDGYPDVYVSNIATMVKDNAYHFPDVNTPLRFNAAAMANMLVKEANMLYLSRPEGGRLVAYEPSQDIERGESSTGWAWDAEFLDFDNDGDDDLYVVNGTNDYYIYHTTFGLPDGRDMVYYDLNHDRERNVFYVNEGGRLMNHSSRSGADLGINSRSTAYLDWDADGDLDVALNNFHDDAVMLRNNAQRLDNHWVKVRLVGDVDRGVNRDAIGARVVATNDADLYLLREVSGGSGFMSMNPKQLHIGLGRAGSVDLEIVWPTGESQRVRGLAANRSYVIHQKTGEVTERGLLTGAASGP